MSTYLQVPASRPMVGTVEVPADKSISHRALIFNGFASGNATINNLLVSADLASTAECLKRIGVSIEEGKVYGRAGTFQAPTQPLDCGNSGTTLRLLIGLLAGQPFLSELQGDESLQGRPMGRVTDHLRRFGARFEGPTNGRTAPLHIIGGPLINQGVDSPIASAQVKTAMMLAGIQGEGTLRFSEPTVSRDHTERMFRAMGIEFNDWVDEDGTHFIELNGPQQLKCIDVDVPGDISSAAFFIVAASIIPDSDLYIPHVGINPTRSGIIDALLNMGGSIEITNTRTVSGEPVGDIRVRHAPLHGTTIDETLFTRMIDEVPVFAIAAAMAAGTTTVHGTSELRVKESNRLEGCLSLARGAGGLARTEEDALTIEGRNSTPKAQLVIDARNDHRIAMSAAIAGLVNEGGAAISGIESIQTSFPAFLDTLGSLCE
ncbi:MAG: 3-phosphoshikimate 1-carboxyvinyltransferase [Myxococcota bacterium]